MQSRVLELWEAAAGERTGGRALALLADAAGGGEREDLGRLPVGRRDASLLALRQRLFGSRYTGVTSCPSCGAEVELSFDAAEVRREVGDAGTVAVDHDGLE